MSNWKITIGSRSFDVSVEERGYGSYSVSLDGQSHDVRVKEADWGIDIQVPGGPTLSVPQSVGVPSPAVRTPERVAPDVKAKKPRPAAAPKPAARPAAPAITGNVIPAPMPGRVVSLQIEKGKDVKAGDPVCVLESMKMENQVNAPRDGKIADVFIKVGDNPNTGAPLASYE